jgi:hypothetical protein
MFINAPHWRIHPILDWSHTSFELFHWESKWPNLYPTTYNQSSIKHSLLKSLNSKFGFRTSGKYRRMLFWDQKTPNLASCVLTPSANWHPWNFRDILERFGRMVWSQIGDSRCPFGARGHSSRTIRRRWFGRNRGESNGYESCQHISSYLSSCQFLVHPNIITAVYRHEHPSPTELRFVQ